MTDVRYTPAYPMAIEADTSTEQSGIDVRHYFAARAPKTPQGWFKPEPTRPRPTIPVPSENEFPEAIVQALHKWQRDRGDYPVEELVAKYVAPPFHDAVRTYCDSVTAADDDLVAWTDEQQRYRLVMWPFAWAEAVLGVDVDIREQLSRYRTIVRLLFEFQGRDVSLREAVLNAGRAAASDYTDGDVTLDRCEQAVAIAGAMAALTFIKAGAEDGRVMASGVTMFVEQAMQELAAAVNADKAATLNQEPS